MLRGINMAGMFENYINTVKGRLADPLGTLATALKEGMPTKENPLGMFGFGGITVHKLKDIGQLGLRVFENPTRDQAIATALKAPDQEVRGFVTKDGKVFVWPSYEAHHAEVQQHLGIPKEEIAKSFTMTAPTLANHPDALFSGDKALGYGAKEIPPVGEVKELPMESDYAKLFYKNPLGDTTK